MKLFTTFLLGLIIACASLIIQVFTSVILELFFRLQIDFQYASTNTTTYIITTILIAASIEEVLRYLVIKNKISYNTPTKYYKLLHGFILGFGFTVFELILISFSSSLLNIDFLISFLPVLMIHSLLSIFLLFTISPKQNKYKDILFVLLAIIFHSLGNLMIYYLALK